MHFEIPLWPVQGTLVMHTWRSVFTWCWDCKTQSSAMMHTTFSKHIDRYTGHLKWMTLSETIAEIIAQTTQTIIVKNGDEMSLQCNTNFHGWQVCRLEERTSLPLPTSLWSVLEQMYRAVCCKGFNKVQVILHAKICQATAAFCCRDLSTLVRKNSPAR